jgi:glycosyltransferase involved in cell wall biosynthesis
MALRLGIGVVTFNRRAVLEQLLKDLKPKTSHPDYRVVVADDGSTDGTLEMLRTMPGVFTVTGANRGVAWNKNRALYALFELLRCDVVILLEDDVILLQPGWEVPWIASALRWGHVNFTGDLDHFECSSGSGTPDDPYCCKHVTAQAAAFTREAILFGGYFDSRFAGFGHEHVEHTTRLMRAGYGGDLIPVATGGAIAIFKCIYGHVQHAPQGSYHTAAGVEKNTDVLRTVLEDRTYRSPWCNETEMMLFRDELRSAKPRIL